MSYIQQHLLVCMYLFGILMREMIAEVIQIKWFPIFHSRQQASIFVI